MSIKMRQASGGRKTWILMIIGALLYLIQLPSYIPAFFSEWGWLGLPLAMVAPLLWPIRGLMTGDMIWLERLGGVLGLALFVVGWHMSRGRSSSH